MYTFTLKPSNGGDPEVIEVESYEVQGIAIADQVYVLTLPDGTTREVPLAGDNWIEIGQ